MCAAHGTRTATIRAPDPFKELAELGARCIRYGDLNSVQPTALCATHSGQSSSAQPTALCATHWTLSSSAQLNGFIVKRKRADGRDPHASVGVLRRPLSQLIVYYVYFQQTHGNSHVQHFRAESDLNDGTKFSGTLTLPYQFLTLISLCFVKRRHLGTLEPIITIPCLLLAFNFLHKE